MMKYDPSTKSANINPSIGQLLFEEAKKCQTTYGGALLLSVKRWLESGETCFEGLELWEAADHCVSADERYTGD